MSTIRMGNDEFIVYIRKWNPSCRITNEQLGSDIGEWIRDNDTTAKQIHKDIAFLWSTDGKNVKPDKLPKTTTQFEFSRFLLPQLYDFFR
jgi:hypothetical protein